MSRRTVLHCLTQWMWLSDSFVHGPIIAGSHRAAAFSRMEAINTRIYPPPADFCTLADVTDHSGGDLAEGRQTAMAVIGHLWPLRPDVVHLHHGYNLPDAAALAAELGVPLVASFWGYDVTALPSREPQRILGHLAAPDVVLVPSRFLARTVEKLGVETSRIRVVPGSVDTRYFALEPLPRAPRVAFVGRFVAKKGVDILLRAWPDVRRAVPDAELTLLGYGERAPSPDPSSGVRVLAPSPNDPRGQVRDLIRWCRVYVSPSTTAPDGDSESQHIGNLEAQAVGRAVLTTDHGPIPEFVEHGVSGIVVAQRDPEALATAMISLLRDDELYRVVATGGRAAVQRHDVTVTAAAHDALYDELAGETEVPREQ